MTTYRNIAIFVPNWVGDAVMATPALKALRRHFADARLIGVLKPYVAGVLEGTGWLDELRFLDPKGPRSQHWPAVSGLIGRPGPFSARTPASLLRPTTRRSAWARASCK